MPELPGHNPAGSIRRRRGRGQGARLIAKSCSVLLLGLCLHARTAFGEWVGQALDLMGTRVSVELWTERRDEGELLVERVLELYREIDERMSTYKESSVLSHVNRTAAMEPVVLDAELFRLIERSLWISELSHGAFDISYESVGYLYDFRARRRPSTSEIETRLAAVDYRGILLDGEHRTLRFAQAGMRINLGGIAKGHAVERGAELLRAAGVRHAVLNAGGDTRVIGDRRGTPWMIGIRHPRLDGAVVTRLPLVDEAISTSGDYERYFDEDGFRYHHILNPATGQPSTGMLSVTVIGPDATMTDALSTAVFVLGADEGLALIESLPQYEAVAVTAAGKLRYSQGLSAPEE